MLKKTVAVLGSTGSVGTQTLQVAKHLGYNVCALTAHGNYKLLEIQAREFCPDSVWIGEDNYVNLKTALADTRIKVLTGENALCELARDAKCDIVCNSLLGLSGLLPTLAAIEGGHDIALSNKEVLVAGGSIVTARAKEKGIKILPVDSEHSAIFQCMGGRKPSRIYLTASGGPFFGKDAGFLKTVTPQMALAHPNWNMGAKITVDSATMMNKGLEIIEAVWLFGVKPRDIEVLVHRESIVHSMVGFEDNSVIAQLARPDMRLCIQYALTYPDRVPSLTPAPDLCELGSLTFSRPDTETFPLLELARRAIEKGGSMPAAMSGANEEAVALFLKGEIGFTDIFTLVSEAAYGVPFCANPNVCDLREADRAAREHVLSAGKRR